MDLPWYVSIIFAFAIHPGSHIPCYVHQDIERESTLGREVEFIGIDSRYFPRLK